LNTTTTSVPPDRHLTAPLYVPEFTATNYGSFFLASQHCTRFIVIQEPLDYSFVNRKARRAKCLRLQPSFLRAFSGANAAVGMTPCEKNLWRYRKTWKSAALPCSSKKNKENRYFIAYTLAYCYVNFEVHAMCCRS